MDKGIIHQGQPTYLAEKILVSGAGDRRIVSYSRRTTVQIFNAVW